MNKPLIEARIKEIDWELKKLGREQAVIGPLTLEDQENMSARAQLKLELGYEIDGLRDEKAELSRELAKPLAEVSIRGEGLHYGRNRDGEEGFFEDYEESIGEI